MEKCLCFNLPVAKPPEDGELAVAVVDLLGRDWEVGSAAPAMMMAAKLDHCHFTVRPVPAIAAITLPRILPESFGIRSRVECGVRRAVGEGGIPRPSMCEMMVWAVVSSFLLLDLYNQELVIQIDRVDTNSNLWEPTVASIKEGEGIATQNDKVFGLHFKIKLIPRLVPTIFTSYRSHKKSR